MAHHGIIKADKHIITTTKELYCSTFLSPQYVCNCSIRKLGKPENNQEQKKTKQQNNVKIVIVARNRINTHVYRNRFICEPFVTFVPVIPGKRESYKYICSFQRQLRTFDIGKILPQMKPTSACTQILLKRRRYLQM